MNSCIKRTVNRFLKKHSVSSLDYKTLRKVADNMTRVMYVCHSNNNNG